MTTSEQARADAMADAATLRLFAGQAEGYLASLLRAELAFATFMPRSVRTQRMPAHYAYICARAAFRAVPGLR